MNQDTLLPAKKKTTFCEDKEELMYYTCSQDGCLTVCSAWGAMGSAVSLSLPLSPFTACNSDQISEESRRLICEDLHGGRECVGVYTLL